jgi:putative hydrolase of the HAD superfamily
VSATGRPVEAVVFDWGGTLTPWHEVDLPQQWRVFARTVHGLSVEDPAMPAEDLAEADSLAMRIHEAEERAWSRGRETHESASIAAILASAGVDPEHDRHHLALAAYQRFWEPHTHTDAQVRPLWESLQRKGIRVGVLSNTIWTRAYHREVFERDGVLDLLDADVYSSEIHVVKPHPEAFLAICDALDVAPERAVYVGDRIFEDVHGPHQVGMRAILVPHSDIPAGQRTAVEARPDAVADELLDVAGIVALWNHEARKDDGDGEA